MRNTPESFPEEPFSPLDEVALILADEDGNPVAPELQQDLDTHLQIVQDFLTHRTDDPQAKNRVSLHIAWAYDALEAAANEIDTRGYKDLRAVIDRLASQAKRRGLDEQDLLGYGSDRFAA